MRRHYEMKPEHIRVLSVLHEDEGWRTAVELAELFGCSSQAMRKWLAFLFKFDLVEKRERKTLDKRFWSFEYRLSVEGENYLHRPFPLPKPPLTVNGHRVWEPLETTD